MWLLIVIFLSLVPAWAYTRQPGEWDFVRNVQLNVTDVDKCQVLCDLDPICRSWSLVKSATTLPNVNNSTDPLAVMQLECYLLSEDMLKITDVVPSVLSHGPAISGEKSFGSLKVAKTKRSNSPSTSNPEVSENVQFQSLFTGPVATDTSTLLNFPQHFVSHCSYTISMWVWIWRPRIHAWADKLVFMAKQIHPRISTHTPLLPAILYNVGAHPDKFFFSATQGRHNDHLGFHRGEVRYHEWIHLAMTVEKNALVAYQDGERLDLLQYGPLDIPPGPVDTCVYDRNVHIQTHNAHSKRSKSQLLKKSTGGAFYDNIVTDPWAAHVNNTILNIASDSHSVEHSTVGMMHQLVVVRNRALTPQQVRQLSEQTRPPSQRTLKALLRKYQVPSLEGICPINCAGDYYLMRSWGICPDSVCGPVCVDENLYVIENYHTGAINAHSKVSIPQVVNLTDRLSLRKSGGDGDGDGDGAGNGGGMVISEYVPPRRPLTPLPDIGYPGSVASSSSPSAKQPYFDAGVFELQHGTVLDFLMPFLTPLNTVLWLLEDMVQYAVDLMLRVQHVHVGVHYLDPFSEEEGLFDDPVDPVDQADPAAAATVFDGASTSATTTSTTTSATASASTGATAKQTPYERWQQGHQQADWYARSREGKVQGLYKTAMVWMNDRYEDTDSSGSVSDTVARTSSAADGVDAATASSSSSLNSPDTPGATSAVPTTTAAAVTSSSSKRRAANVAQNFNAWRAESAEKAQAALMLAMWMATDVSNRRDPLDQPWAFQTSPLLAQPLRLALGYQKGFDGITEDFVPMGEIQALLVLPTSPVLGSVLKETHLIETLLHPGAENALVTGSDADPSAHIPEAGEFYIDQAGPVHSDTGGQITHEVEEPDNEDDEEEEEEEDESATPTASSAATSSSSSSAVRQDFRFTVDENGEVVIVHEPKERDKSTLPNPADVPKAPPKPARKRSDGRPTKTSKSRANHDGPVTEPVTSSPKTAPVPWLAMFAELNTDNIKAALNKELKPLVSHGLTSAYVHSVIIAKQMRRSTKQDDLRVRQARQQHGVGDAASMLTAEELMQASTERAAVDEQLARFVRSLHGMRLHPSSTPASAAFTTAAGSGVTTAAASASAPATAPAGERGGALTDTECSVAAAYYFPVTQYVSAQYGMVHSGTGILEEVRLIVSGGKPDGQAGEDDILHQHTEAEAYDGNAHAQTWLAKKYYWGFGGVERNENMARHWFEQAAAQNDPEGLYNVGIFHNNGQAGVPQNAELALRYFQRAADHPDNPFPMAMNAVGNIYLHDAQKKNVSRAMEYFLKAATHRSDDAHFSLAMLYREGVGCPKDVPRSVAHLAVAASWGHVRALNFLAHALYDSDSWLAQHGREQHEVRRKHAMLSLLTSRTEKSAAGVDKGASTGTSRGTAGRGGVAKDEASSSSTDSSAISSASSSNGTAGNNATDHSAVRRAYMDSLLKASLVFNEFELIKIYMPDGSIVPMPYPLGNPKGSCQAALPLLKHLAEMSYRPKDLTRRALKEYLRGDYWAALGHYEEAADLGVWAAQENAAYLIERMLPTECAQYEDYVLMSGPGTGTGDSHADNSNDRGDVSSRGDASSGAAAVTVSANSATSGSDGRGGGGGARYKCRTAEECCKQYLSKLATRRWAQLAQAGEPRAMRKVADALLDPTQPYMLSDHRAVSTSSLVAPTSSGAVAASADDNNGSTPVLSTQQQAALLYALAGEQGDSESLLHLGWMLYYGEGVQRNQTTANALFNAAMKIEAGEELLGEEAALAAEDAAYDDSFGGPFGGDGGGVGNDDAAGLDGYTAAGATAEEDAAALQEASLSRHEHARRWHIAGYASKTTGGAAPALALAVVRADAMLRDFGFNTTVQELHVQAEVFLNAYMPDTLKDWWTADHRKQKKQQRTGVWGLLSNISRRLRATHRWIRQVEEQDSELYNALWETALLVAIIIVSNLLFRAFRH